MTEDIRTLVVMLWRPFLWCTAKIRKQWNLRHSIIDAFATFLLLSYMKLLNTSVDLLITTKLHDVHGSKVDIICTTMRRWNSSACPMPYLLLLFLRSESCFH